MAGIRPHDPRTLATVTANALVVAADEEGTKAANLYYWHRARPVLAPVVEKALHLSDDPLRSAAEKLLGDPADARAHRAVRDLLESALTRAPSEGRPGGTPGGAAGEATDGATGEVADLCRAAWDAVARCRVDFRLGSAYGPHDEIGTEDLLAHPAGDPAPSPHDPEVLVVVPFRDASAHGGRLRNALACLLALRDQSMDRARYRVVVVEADQRPRWRHVLSRYADEYLFAEHAGPFNRSWLMNAGVRNAVGDAGAICMLDGDALVDREFLERNAARFLRPGTGGFLPFRDLYYLDPAASARAIDDRCLRGRNAADPETLRGFVIHRAQGLCVWLRRDVFDATGGMDERYQGWGREDIDFVLRLHLSTAFHQFDDPMLHLHHPSSATLVDGQTVNQHIPFLSWSPDGETGRLDRYPAG